MEMIQRIVVGPRKGKRRNGIENEKEVLYNI
jgi:hypothetical protein